MVKRKPKCSGIEIKPSKSFEGMYAIHINGKVFDEPHSSKIKAMNQIKRFKKSFGCKR